MENTAYQYVRNFEAQELRFIKRDPHKLYKGIRGYFMVSDVDKITVYHRYQEKGYIYNYTVIKKLTTFFVVRHKNCGFSKPPAEEHYSEVSKIMQKKKEWYEVHNSIESIENVGDVSNN